MNNMLFTHWKTTLIGMILAASAIIQASGKPTLEAAYNDPVIQTKLLVAVLGVLCKDLDKA